MKYPDPHPQKNYKYLVINFPPLHSYIYIPLSPRFFTDNTSVVKRCQDGHGFSTISTTDATVTAPDVTDAISDNTTDNSDAFADLTDAIANTNAVTHDTVNDVTDGCGTQMLLDGRDDTRDQHQEGQERGLRS